MHQLVKKIKKMESILPWSQICHILASAGGGGGGEIKKSNPRAKLNEFYPRGGKLCLYGGHSTGTISRKYQLFYCPDLGLNIFPIPFFYMYVL